MSILFRLNLFSFLIVILASIHLQAQDLFSISKITPDDGLSQGSNYFRFEDSKGFMWITCNDALNRYDGKMVKVYNLDRYFKNCPALQQGYGFAEDAASNIYVGSTRGLYIYNRKQDKFTLQKIFTNSVDDIAMPIGCIDGKIWCYNRFYQLATYDVITKKIKLETQVKAFEPLNSIHVYQLQANVFYYHFPFVDNQKNIWISSNIDMACINTQTKSITFPFSNLLKNNIIYSSAFCSADDNIYMGLLKGIIKYNTITHKTNFIENIGRYNLNYVTQILANSNMVIMQLNNKLKFIDTSFKKIIWEEVDGLKSYFLTNNYKFDKSGRVWMNRDGKGEIILTFKPKLLHTIPKIKSKMPVENVDGVSIITEMPDSNIVLEGNYIYNIKSNTVTAINVDDLINPLYRTALDKSRNGVWFYSDPVYMNYYKKQLFFYNGTTFSQKLLLDTKKNELLLDIIVLPDSRIITAQSSGLYWVNLVTKKFEHINEVPQKSAFKINVLTKKRLAVSYLNSAMLLLELISDHSLKIIKNILPGVQSFYMQEDSVRNIYWVGTNEGVYLLDKNFNKLKKFDANTGLAGTYIYGLLLDNDGNVWCSHQRGLSSINTTNFQIINYDKSDGIQDWDFNNRAFCKASDGTLYFGGVSGVNYFKPPLKPQLYYKPEVYVDEILVNNNIYLPDSNANYIQHLSLTHLQNNINIKAIIKDLENANNDQLIYKILETDTKWKLMPNNNIVFNNLAPGKYTLELGTYDKYNNKEIVQKTISILIASPFYFKIWFWVLLAIIISALIFLFYYRRNLNIHKNHFEQKLALEKQRSKITADLHDDIGASLSSLQVNSMVASQLINKDVTQTKIVLGKIENQSKEIAEKIGDIIWSMKPGKEEFINLSSRIKNFASDILGATEIKYQINVDKQLDSLVQEITLRKNLLLITKEAINNAAKYSKGSVLTIELKLHENEITFLVKDNGIGFDVESTKGNGIQNMKRRVDELKGKISIVTNHNSGTSIMVSIPFVAR